MSGSRLAAAVSAIVASALAWGGLANAVISQPEVSIPSDYTATATPPEATTQVVCPAVKRVVYRYYSADGQLLREEAQIASAEPTPLRPPLNRPAGTGASTWVYGTPDGAPTSRVADTDKPDPTAGSEVAGDTVVTLVAQDKTTVAAYFHSGTAITDTQVHTQGGHVTTVPLAHATHHGSTYFAYWSLTPDGDEVDPTTVTLTEDTHFYAVFKSGHEVQFDSQGGSDVIPDHFTQSPYNPPASRTPSRPGYDFAYWSLTPDGEAFTPEATPEDDFTLYAHWTPRTDTPYRVVHWKEAREGERYVIATNEKKTGTTEQVVRAEPIDITDDSIVVGGKHLSVHYLYNAERSQPTEAEIDGSGETVINLYYDRPRVTLTYAASILPETRLVRQPDGALVETPYDWTGFFYNRLLPALETVVREDPESHGIELDTDALNKKKIATFFEKIAARVTPGAVLGYPGNLKPVTDYTADTPVNFPRRDGNFGSIIVKTLRAPNGLAYAKSYKNFRAGLSTIPLVEDFDREFLENASFPLEFTVRIKPKAGTAPRPGYFDFTVTVPVTAAEMWADSLYVYHTPNAGGQGRLTNTPDAPPFDTLYPRLFSESDPTGAYSVHYVEVDPNRRGQPMLPETTAQGKPDPKKALGGNNVDILTENIISPGRDIRFSELQDEDYIPIPGFTTLESGGIKQIQTVNKGTPDESKHRFVRYLRNSYTVTYVANGGPGGDVKSRVLYDFPLSSAKVPNYVPNKTIRERDDAVFVGWYDNPDLLGKPVDTVAERMPTHDFILYAKWRTQDYTVRFHGWDPQSFVDAPIEKEVTKHSGQRLTAAEREPNVPEGFERRQFRGWYYLDGASARPFLSSTPIHRDYDLFPFWPIMHTRVVYDAGKGSGTVPVDSERYNRMAGAVALPAPDLHGPDGQEFAGWVIQGRDDTLYRPGERFSLMPSKNDVVRLIAVYRPGPRDATLTYMPNGADAQPLLGRFSDLAKVTVLPEDTFTRPGYRFLGWSLTANGEPIACGPGTAMLVPAGHSRLYALWHAEAVAVTIRKVDGSGTLLSGAGFSLGDPEAAVADATPLTPGEQDGTFSVTVQPGRHYWLHETTAPAGHELMPIPIAFHVSDGTVVLDEPDALPNVSVSGTTLTISNVPAGHLPATGGRGHLPYLAGGVLLLIAALYLQRRPITRRK